MSQIRNKFFKKDLYICDFCNYSTSKLSNFQRHILTLKHQNSDNNLPVDLAVPLVPVQAVPVQDQDDPGQPIEFMECSFDETENLEIVHSDNGSTGSVSCDEVQEAEESTSTGNQERTEAEEWFPYESKLHFLLTVLHSSKTHRISDEVLSFFLFILKECGLKNVPSLSKIKSFWTDELPLDEMIQQNEDQHGNVHWMMKPSSMLKLLISNPNTASSIDRYPKKQSHVGPQSSAQKWCNEIKFHWGQGNECTNDNLLLGDIIEFQKGDEKLLGKISQFICNDEGKLCIELVELRFSNDPIFRSKFRDELNLSLVIMDGPLQMICIEDCKKYENNIPLEIWRRTASDNFVSLTDTERTDFLQTTSLWKGKPIVTVPVNIFIDDLSANQSRRWAPMHAIQGQASGLQLEEKNKDKNAFVIAASETTSMTELLSPVCEDIKICKEIGINAYDALLEREVTLTTDISSIIADYQMMSLACNHMGPSANKFCPKCFADKSDPFKMWSKRTASSTKRTLDRLKINPSRGTALQTETGVKLYENCLWDHVDPHKDTPIGILHFLYLGLAKHLIQHCVHSLTENQLKTAATHLKSIDQSSFSYRVNGDSFFKYLDSRQGKDYKHYLQLAPFNMAYAGLKGSGVEALERLALISKHLYQQENHEIVHEVENYLELLRTKIPDLGKKCKSHLCVHLADDIQRHGHPLHFSEDVFEKNHKVIRSGLQHQNGHSKSRDTAVQFAKSELTKHIVTGGYIPVEDEWKQANNYVVTYGKHKKVQSFLGVHVLSNKQMPGHVRKLTRSTSRKPKNDRSLLDSLELLMIDTLLGGNISLQDQVKFHECKECLAGDGEYAKIGNFVLYRKHEQIYIGSLKKVVVLQSKQEMTTVAFVKRGECTTDIQKNCQKVQESDRTEAVKTTDILNAVHTIHDCKGGYCRIAENQSGQYLKHSSHPVHIINKFRLSKLPDTLTDI